MSFDWFITICLIVSALSLTITALYENSSKKGSKMISRTSFFIGLFATIVFFIAVFAFSPITTLTERVYENSKIVSTTEIQLTTLNNTNYYLVQDREEYRYYSQGQYGNKQESRVAISQCEKEYNSNSPQLTIEEISKSWHRKWLFLYEDGTYWEENYIFSIPSEESILDLDDL